MGKRKEDAQAKKGRKRKIMETMTSSSDERPRKRLSVVFASTPTQGARVPSSLSASTIEWSTPLYKKEKRKTAKKKKHQKHGKTRGKKTVSKESESTDDQWVTLEIEEKENQQSGEEGKSTIEKSVTPRLFEEMKSPEVTRDIPIGHFPDYQLQSPILNRRKFAESPDRIEIDKTILPLEDLPCTQLRVDSDDEEELVFRPTETMKMYTREKKKKKEIRVERNVQLKDYVPFPTAVANLLWDRYVNEHPEEMKQWTSKRSQKQSVTEENSGKEPINPLWGFQTISPNMVITRGTWDKRTKKFVNETVTKLYDFGAAMNEGIPRDPITKKPTITLNEFLAKRRAEKQVSRIASSSKNAKETTQRNFRHKKRKVDDSLNVLGEIDQPSTSINPQNVENDISVTQPKRKKTTYSVPSHFEDSNTLMEDTSSPPLRKSKLRKRKKDLFVSSNSENYENDKESMRSTLKLQESSSNIDQSNEIDENAQPRRKTRFWTTTHSIHSLFEDSNTSMAQTSAIQKSMSKNRKEDLQTADSSNSKSYENKNTKRVKDTSESQASSSRDNQNIASNINESNQRRRYWTRSCSFKKLG